MTVMKSAFVFAALVAVCTACAAPHMREPVCVSPRATGAEGGELCYPLDGGLSDFFSAGKIRSGDMVRLRQAHYGSLKIKGMRFDEQVLLMAEPGQEASFDSIEIAQSSNVSLRGLKITSNGTLPPGSPLVHVDKGSVDIVLDELLVQSTPNAERWTDEDWRKSARHGITSFGRNIVIKNSLLRNVRHGITTAGDNSQVLDNRIVNFSGDGIRGLGNDSTYSRNSIRNCYDVDDNHDDGFQSWSLGKDKKPGKGVVRNVVLRGNLILNHTDPNQPFRCNLQGIGLFDGLYENWIIEDNTVIVDHWHGITVMGARNVRVNHNTVIDRNPSSAIAPWVTVTRHKDGTAPSGSVVRNNVMMRVFRKRQDGGGHKFDLHQTGVSVRDNLELDPSDVQASVSPDGSVDIPDYAPGKTIGARYLIPDAN